MNLTDTDQEELRGWTALALTDGLAAKDAIRLLSETGSAAAAFSLSLTDLARLVGMSAAERIRAAARGAMDEETDAVLEWLRNAPDARLVTVAEPEYPSGLVAAGTGPLALFARGSAKLLTEEPVAVLGTCDPDDEGADNARAFGAAIALAGAPVLATLESGIPAAALEGALSERKAAAPVALLATGAARAPKDLAALQRRVLEAGGLLLTAEAPLTGLSDETRARRDRLIPGVARKFLLIEADLRDPSVGLARAAAELGASVGALPGNIHEKLAKGGNQLIREGAMLVESVADLGLD
ncbi:DNA-processing protein DprA [Sutterella sp.]|uniref:DNA-processing protein DprA n=1 Tax=Sutterella sp. TaxID=1981025 RepID=UPI0026DFEAB6|nr:DNA-processing protein DprA [Sutterella sp.]MDO5530389.1 DNA-processing protein DprA [Sutterella sp.]